MNSFRKAKIHCSLKHLDEIGQDEEDGWRVLFCPVGSGRFLGELTYPGLGRSTLLPD